MRVIETKVFRIEEHPNRDAVYNWIRDHWYDLDESDSGLFDLCEANGYEFTESGQFVV